MIEVWRPGRPEGRHRPRPARRDRRSQDSRQARATATSGRRAGREAPARGRSRRGGCAVANGRADCNQPAPWSGQSKDAIRAIAAGTPASIASEHRPDRPQRERERARPPVKRFERREKAARSEFAVRQARGLKAQLEADAKERR